MNLDNVYSFTVSRQNSSELPPGRSPCVKIKFIKDESIAKPSPKYKTGLDSISERNSASDDEKPEIISDVSGSSPLSICPIYDRDYSNSENVRIVLSELIRLIEKKDSHLIFAYPVTEEQAPNYSNVIDHPMDLQTIHYKIDNGGYKHVADLTGDLILMCQNALTYNTPDTFYYKFAAQMLNYVKKIFSRESLNKFVVNKLNWTRVLTDEEVGDWNSCQTRMKFIQSDITKNVSISRPQRGGVQRHGYQDVVCSKRKSDVDIQLVNSKRSSLVAISDNVTQSEQTDSEGEDNYSNNLTSDEEEDDDSDVLNDVLINAQKAALNAKQRLEQLRPLPVVYLDQTDENISIIHTLSQDVYTMENDFQKIVKRIGSANIEQMIGENDRVLSQLNQLCHDTNESVALTTSKPLEPYSCAEQAVLVETFGDVVTAEFACNMHNFVLDLPQNSAAVEQVKSKLNTATNYLTYGVDQIIIKKLKAAAEVSRN